jgi:hypothetical protein
MSDNDTDDEVILLRAQFPGHRIGTETIVDRIRYVARSQRTGAHPHTVITRYLNELRAALEAGRTSDLRPLNR